MIWSVYAIYGIDYLFIQPNEKFGRRAKVLRCVLKVLVMVGLSLSVVNPGFREALGGMANVFLLLSVVVMIGVVSWQIVVLEVKYLDRGCIPMIKTLIRYS